jgi:hypothetical protein
LNEILAASALLLPWCELMITPALAAGAYLAVN